MAFDARFEDELAVTCPLCLSPPGRECFHRHALWKTTEREHLELRQQLADRTRAALSQQS